MLIGSIVFIVIAVLLLLVSYARSRKVGDGKMRFVGLLGLLKSFWDGIVWFFFGDDESKRLANLVHILVYVFGTFIMLLGLFILANAYPVLEKFSSAVLTKIRIDNISIIVTTLAAIFTLLIVVGTIVSEFLTFASLDDRDNNRPKKPTYPEEPNTLKMSKEQREKALKAFEDKVKEFDYETFEYKKNLKKWKQASHSRRISILNKFVAFMLFCLLAYINYEGFHISEVKENVKEANVVKIAEDYEINEISESIKRKQQEYDNFIELQNKELENASIIVKRQNPGLLGMNAVKELQKQEAHHRKQADKYLAQANKIKAQITHLESRKLDQKERLSSQNQSEISRYTYELQSAANWSMAKTVLLDLSLYFCIFLFVRYRNKSMAIELSHSEHSVSAGSDNTRITTGNRERNIVIGDSKTSEERKGIDTAYKAPDISLGLGFSKLITSISNKFKSEKPEISGDESEISKPKSGVKSEISEDISVEISKEEPEKSKPLSEEEAKKWAEKLLYVAKKIQLPKRYYPMPSQGKLAMMRAVVGLDYGYPTQSKMWDDFEEKYDRDVFVKGSAGRDVSDMKKIYESLEAKDKSSIFSILKSL